VTPEFDSHRINAIGVDLFCTFGRIICNLCPFFLDFNFGGRLKQPRRENVFRDPFFAQEMRKMTSFFYQIKAFFPITRIQKIFGGRMYPIVRQ